MGLVVDAAVGEGGHGDGHVEGAGLVLPQDDAFVGLFAVFGQGLRDSRQGAGHAQGVSHVGGVLGGVLQVLLQPDEGGVVGAVQRVLDGAGAAVAGDVVHGEPAGQGQRGGGVLGRQGDALLEGGRQAEDLERGSGLVRGVAVVPAGGVLSAVVAADGAGARLHGDDAGGGVLLQGRQVGRHRVQGGVLGVHVDRRGDLQAPGGDLFLGDADRLEFGDHVVFDVAVGALRLGVGGVFGGVAGLGELQGVAGGRLEVAFLHHAVEDVAPPAFGAFRVGPGLELVGHLDDAGQQRAFFDGQLAGGLVEVGVGGGLEAVGVAAEVHRVQVGGEDGLLVPLVGHLDGVDQLFGFALDGVLVADQDVFDVLLGDRGTAAGGVVARQLADDRAAETRHGEAAVGPELPVFGGEHRVLDVFRHLLQRNLAAVAVRRDDARELCGGVGGEDRRDLRGRHFLRLRDVDPDVVREERAHRDRDDHG